MSPPDISDHAQTDTYKGLGLANLLMKAGLEWASQHPNAITPPISPTVAEHRKLELGAAGGDDGYWKGLVLVHAQESVQKMYTRYGFVTDEAMGKWDEEGITHVGMWKRLELKPGGYDGRRKSLRPD